MFVVCGSVRETAKALPQVRSKKDQKHQTPRFFFNLLPSLHVFILHTHTHTNVGLCVVLSFISSYADAEEACSE